MNQYLREVEGGRAALERVARSGQANLGGAAPYIMHNMPVHPGFEIDETLVESEHSVIYQQAENRMHIEAALLINLLGAAGDKVI